MKKIYILMFVCVIAAQISAQNSEYLRVGDVRYSWTTYPGTIDSVTIMVEPKGFYAEIQMLVDYSTRCTSYNQGDSLEIQMGFHLPHEAEVTDLWLWFFNEPIRARMMDRWTATMIYENIVSRREDPVLLLKNSETFYDMKIFPLMTDMPRRIKLTYLVPFHSLTSGHSIVPLPANFIRLSHCPLHHIRIGFRVHPDMVNPVLTEYPASTFSPFQDPYFGQCLMTELPSLTSNSLNLKVQNTSFSSETFAGISPPDSSGHGFYQVELNLTEIFNINRPKKTIFLFDIVKANTTLSYHYVLNTFKNYISNYYSAGDSLNIMFGGMYTNTLSSGWVSADPVSLDQFLGTVDTTLFNPTSNLSVLLFDAIDYVRNNGNDANIFLISSSNAYQNTNTANTLINNTMVYMGMPRIPIHIISLDDKSYVSWNNWNYLFRGNEYLFSNLSQMTGGEFEIILKAIYDYWYYYVYNYTSFEMMLSKMLPKLSGYFTTNNVFVAMQSGFTFSSYTVTSPGGFVYFDSPYRMTGKYQGSPPFNLVISAQDDLGQVYNAQISIGNQDIKPLDSLSRHLWAGQYLRELLTYPQSNSIINHIIHTSMLERVLTKYTALLAVEPESIVADTLQLPPDPNPDWPIIGIEDEYTENNNPEDAFSFYPNPVTDNLNFELYLSENATVRFEIFNVLNQLVDEGEADLMPGKNIYKRNLKHLPEGMYVFMVIVNKEVRYSGKIVVRR